MLKRYKFLLVLFFLIIGAISAYVIVKSAHKSETYTLVTFNRAHILEEDKDILSFVKPFQDACKVFLRKSPRVIITTDPILTYAGDWQEVCRRFDTSSFTTSTALTNFITDNFLLYSINGGTKSKITGYYRLNLKGSTTPNKVYKYPVYSLPKDLIVVNLKNFSPDLPNRNIVGRVDGRNLVPYYTRGEIYHKKKYEAATPIVYVDNPYDVFLLHVQGSGKVVLSNKVMYLSYAGSNGLPFNGITNELKKRKLLNTPLKDLNQFFIDNPDIAKEVMGINPCFIFFKEVDKKDWNAAFGTPPVAQRTVAVDKNITPLGVPVFVKVDLPSIPTSINHLTVANDIGSAIKGPGRIDLYWGEGNKARDYAISTNNYGTVYMLLVKPKIAKNH